MKTTIVLTALITASVVSEAAGFALEHWRAVDIEGRILESIGVFCIVAFVSLLWYEHRAEK